MWSPSTESAFLLQSLRLTHPNECPRGPITLSPPWPFLKELLTSSAQNVIRACSFVFGIALFGNRSQVEMIDSLSIYNGKGP